MYRRRHHYRRYHPYYRDLDYWHLYRRNCWYNDYNFPDYYWPDYYYRRRF